MHSMKRETFPRQGRRLGYKTLIPLLATLLVLVGVGLNMFQRQTVHAAGNSVQVWLSSQDGSNQLTQQSDLTITSPDTSSITAINVDANTTYQTIDGFGGTFTDSDVYNFGRLSDANQTAALTALLDPTNGAGWNLMRVQFGNSDWNRAWGSYNYDENGGSPDDSSLSHFSIQTDIDRGFINVIKKALQINPNLKIFASIWHQPSWMDTTNSSGQNVFNSNYNAQYVTYIRKAIQAYQSQGIPIYAVSVQNEPKNCAFTCWDWSQERDVVKLLRTELDTNQINTKIWLMDHNFDMAQTYAKPILDDSGARSAVDAVAFHDYGGDPTDMQTLATQYSIPVRVSERNKNDIPGMDRVIQYLRNGALSFNQWTSIQDDYNGPQQWGGYPAATACVASNCGSMLTIKRDDASTWFKNYGYYDFAQFTKFIQRGAIRISSDYGSSSTITTAAFRNPDGTFVLVAVNQNSSSQQFKILTSGGQITATLPANSVGTYIWSSGTPGTTSINDNTTGTGLNQFDYNGSWSYGSQAGAYQNDNHWSGTTDAYYQVRFSGVEVKVYAAKDPNSGIGAVSIDGGSETDVDYYAPWRQDNTLVWSSPILSAGSHTLKMRVSGRNNPSSGGTWFTADRVDIVPSSLNGTAIGAGGSYSANNATDYTKATDGNTGTYFDPNTTPAWTGLDFGTAHTISRIRFYPRDGYAYRMVNGKFQGSNTADFSSGVTDLATITTSPPNNQWTEIGVTNTTAFRYVRYIADPSQWCNIAEMQFFE